MAEEKKREHRACIRCRIRRLRGGEDHCRTRRRTEDDHRPAPRVLEQQGSGMDTCQDGEARTGRTRRKCADRRRSKEADPGLGTHTMNDERSVESSSCFGFRKGLLFVILRVSYSRQKNSMVQTKDLQERALSAGRDFPC